MHYETDDRLICFASTLVQKWKVSCKCLFCGKKKTVVKSSDEPDAYDLMPTWMCSDCSLESPLDKILKNLKKMAK